MEMTVTGIEPFPKGKGRVAIYLNDRFAFVLYKGELSQYGLETGMVMDDDLYESILSGTLIPRAKKRGMNLLRTMDRTEHDVRQKLSEGGYPIEAVDAAVEYLSSYHYIDDMRYACEYIRYKIQSYSRKVITLKLTEKGIGKDVIEAAFDRYEEENDINGHDAEMELIQRLIRKRCPHGVENLDHEGKQKLYAYLYGKGFEIGAVDDALKDIRGQFT